VHNILTDHSQKLGAFPLAAQEDVWGRDPHTRLAAGLDPVGKARRVAGGVIYSGRHSFSSGIDHVQWVICGGHIAEAQGPPRRGYFLVPKSDIRVIDDWHVAGLAGTGSKSFEVSEIFVPAHRILDGEASDDGRGPGTEADSAPIFRMPRSGIPGTGFAAVTVGMAQGFIAEWIGYTRPRKSRGQAVADLMGTQISAGLASAQVDAASRLYLGATRAVMQTLERGGKVGPEQRLHTRLCTAYAGQLVLAAVNRLSNAAGGRAFYTSNDLQRQFRDITMAAAHYSLAWDNVAAAYGKHMLGAEP
jgi:3-hydroxy-9,10-secoandrosta-1,3,5(10)-triene-9,17-dione monooxygenase